ncbi:MAG: rod shape-determining protein RodA [Opitutales bacterium TMED158]|nr:MAG: rod shape-determining protein RodA [Opitutales bacterium TMED158]
MSRRSAFSYEYSRLDLISPLCIIALSVIGVFFIYSAQHYQQSNDWIKQIVWVCVGFSAYVVVSYLDYKLFLKYSHWLYFIALILLALVAFCPYPIGITIYGAKRWLNVGFTTIQPSELAKMACLVMAANLLTRSEIGTLKESRLTLAKMALAISIPFLFILFQPDLGSALIIPSVVFAQLYASNLSKSFFTTAIAIGVLLVGLVAFDTHRYAEYVNADRSEGQVVEEPRYWIPVLEDYQRERVMGFLYPDKVNRRDEGWNREQSIISVGSGGLFGKGYLNGNQAQLGYLPRAVAHNDFIFSVLAEETGFLGSVVVVTLFGLLIGNSIRIATIARDRFGTLLAIGVATLFSVHVFVNIAMTIGLMPITGLPLPFLSHGGTFMVSCCVLQGLAQSVYRFRKEF